MNAIKLKIIIPLPNDEAKNIYPQQLAEVK